MSCGLTPGCPSREDLFRIRLRQVLSALNCQFPSLFRYADFWRQQVVSYDQTAYADDQTQKWVRLDERVPIFFYEKMERFFQAENGIINERVTYVFVTEDINLVAGDHILTNGFSYMIVNIDKQAGVMQLKISPEKSNFVQPARGTPTYRILSMRARMA